MPADQPAAPSTLPGLPGMLCFAVYSANHALQRAYQAALAEWDLTYPQYLVLVALAQGQEMTVTALGRAMHLESNTLTPLLKRMEARGLLTRQRQAADERQVLLRLTEAGRQIRDAASARAACLFEDTGLPRDQIETLREAVGELRDRVRGAADPAIGG